MRVTTAFGVWLVLGLFTDGWAHLNVSGPETVFTPWHGVLYSGFSAGALWLGVLALRGRGSVGPGPGPWYGSATRGCPADRRPTGVTAVSSSRPERYRVGTDVARAPS